MKRERKKQRTRARPPCGGSLNGRIIFTRLIMENETVGLKRQFWGTIVGRYGRPKSLIITSRKGLEIFFFFLQNHYVSYIRQKSLNWHEQLYF